jgi:hypothetical protein
MLLALAKKLLGEAKPPIGDVPNGTLTAFQPYPQLRYGEIDGIGTVTIDQTGNMVGFSPVERCLHNGETAWIPTAMVKNLRLEPFVFTPTPTR